jgi:BlaI family transcriptional regulator, penicillinase repressor
MSSLTAKQTETKAMSKSQQPAMSDAEREVLKVLWDSGPLGVRNILARLTESGRDWTRSTVVTLLHRLEAKRYIEGDKSQYAFIYRPLVSREEVIHARVSELAGELSDGKAVPLMLAFAERQRFSVNELARLQQMIDDLKRRTRGK